MGNYRPGNGGYRGKSSMNRFGGRDRRGGFGRGNQDRSQMHEAICGKCGERCQVPFKPTEGKPVYCRECFKNHRKF